MGNDIRFSLQVWNRVNMSGSNIAAEIIASLSGNRKWASISPLSNDDGRGLYRYFEIELPKEIVEHDLDWSEPMEITEEIFVSSLADLYQLLDSKGIDPLSFDAPWKVNYPY